MMCILIPVIVGIISALLGYLLGKLTNNDNQYSSKITALEADLAACRNHNSKLEEIVSIYRPGNSNTGNSFAVSLSQNDADLASSKSKIAQLEAELDACKSDYDALKTVSQNSNFNTDIENYREQISKLETDLRLCKSKSTVLENDLETCKMEKARLEDDIKNTSALGTANIASTNFEATMVPAISFDADKAKSILGKRVKQDDLKLIEGIGPKIEQLFHTHNIKTWKALSETSIETCKEVLKSGGKRFEMHKPNTWPKQAKLAYEGKWQELLDWQDQLDGGR